MADEKEKPGEKGSEYPLFKSEGGAFDRAKFKSTIRMGAGTTIPAETFEAMKAADSTIDAAKLFYDSAFDKEIKSIDPSYDPKDVFYQNAYGNEGEDRKLISRRIDEGEAVDGKEIIEYAKSSAANKVSNVKELRNGTVTQIIEAIGLGDIEIMKDYEKIANDFDAKMKDEKGKDFDTLLQKFSEILSYFNEKGPTASMILPKISTPENIAVISALAKILESEGIVNNNVKTMSERYDDNLAKLIEKSKGGSIESMQMTKEGDVTKKGEGVTEEKKLEEKKEETPPAPVPTPAAPVEEPKVAPVEPAVETKAAAAEPALPATTSTETKLEEAKSTAEPTGSTGTVKSEPAKIDSSASESKVNNMIKDLFGIDLGATGGTGGTGGTGKAESETEKLAAKKAEDLVGPLKGGTGSTEGTEKKDAEKKKDATKLETKIDKKNDKVNETLPASTGKIETTTQNLSSVSTQEEKPKEAEPSTTNTNNTSISSSTSSTEGATEGSAMETPKSETTNNEKKGDENKKEGTDNNEMLETMKSMVSLLTQLNSTMQGPLIVTPTNKKFQ